MRTGHVLQRHKYPSLSVLIAISGGQPVISWRCIPFIWDDFNQAVITPNRTDHAPNDYKQKQGYCRDKLAIFRLPLIQLGQSDNYLPPSSPTRRILIIQSLCGNVKIWADYHQSEDRLCSHRQSDADALLVDNMGPAISHWVIMNTGRRRCLTRLYLNYK